MKRMMLSGAGTLRFIAAGCLSLGVTRGRPKVWRRTPPQTVVSSAPGRDDQLADVAVRNGVLLVAVDDCPGHGRGGDAGNDVLDPATGCEYIAGLDGVRVEHLACHRQLEGDRKSTRLNSSHVAISYAVFCLKK